MKQSPWQLNEDLPVEWEYTFDNGEATRHHGIPMMQSEESSVSSVAYIHGPQRQMWRIQIVNGQPVLEQVRQKGGMPSRRKRR